MGAVTATAYVQTAQHEKKPRALQQGIEKSYRYNYYNILNALSCMMKLDRKGKLR